MKLATFVALFPGRHLAKSRAQACILFDPVSSTFNEGPM